MKRSNVSIIDTITHPGTRETILKTLGEYIKEAAEKTRPVEMIDVSGYGQHAVKIAGQQLPYDESKPRASNRLVVQNTINHPMIRNSIVDVFELIDNATKRAGFELGATINGNCASCSSLQTSVAAQEEIMHDAIAIRFMATCGHGNNVVGMCPDMYLPTSIDVMSGRHDHTTDAMRYATEFGFLNMKTRGYGALDLEPLSFTKPKEVVTDLDVEVEILKLDENYGLF